MVMALTVRDKASISHTHPWCGPDVCGHNLAVSVVLEGPRAIKGTDTIVGALGALVHELDRRPLTSSIPGSDGSLWALAAWIYERLSQSYTALASVSVDFGDGTATYRRDI